jgi:hypothetical protein
MDSRPLKALLENLGRSVDDIRELHFDPETGKCTKVLFVEAKPTAVAPTAKPAESGPLAAQKAKIVRRLTAVDSLAQVDRHWGDMPPESE